MEASAFSREPYISNSQGDARDPTPLSVVGGWYFARCGWLLPQLEVAGALLGVLLLADWMLPVFCWMCLVLGWIWLL